MGYLMVIVQGGERPPCLHAGICGVQFRVEAPAAAVERQEGDGEISLWAFFFPLHRFPALMKTSFIWPHKTEDGRGNLNPQTTLKTNKKLLYRGVFSS